MVATRLDEIDRKILSQLARRVGISAPPCLRRVRSLEESGLIRGYHAEVNARELGFEVRWTARPRSNSTLLNSGAATGRWCANATC